MMGQTSQNHSVVELLKVLKCTAVPKAVDSGAAITYLALKDRILDNAIFMLDTLDTEDTPRLEMRLYVDHHKLASAVVERTFDLHTQVLRQKLKEAEEDAQMWRKVSLFGRSDTSRNSFDNVEAMLATPMKQQLCIGTQTTTDAVPSNGKHIGNHLASVERWFTLQTESFLVLLDGKVLLLRDAQLHFAAENQSLLENKKRTVLADDSAEASKSNRSLPNVLIAGPRTPTLKTAIKAPAFTPLRRTAASPVATGKNISLKSPINARKPAPLSIGKRENSAFSLRQNCTPPSLAARDIESEIRAEPLYVLQTMRLKPRDIFSPVAGAQAARHGRGRLATNLPQL